MRPTLPHRLSAVPQSWPVRAQILDAARTLLTEHGEDLRKRRRDELGAIRRDLEQIAQGLLALQCEWPSLLRAQLRKYRPDQPRVPKGNPHGGEWTREGASGPAGVPGVVLSDATPDNTWKPGTQYAANEPPGIGHNQGPPLQEPPQIPPRVLATRQAINNFLKAAANWLTEAKYVDKRAAALFLAALAAVVWIADKYLPYIITFQDPPKTLEELQQAASAPKSEYYNDHHLVEKKAAADDGFLPSMIDGPENVVRIPTLKHWLITGWYQTRNPDFGDLSPRQYLRGKSWDERVRVGKQALILFGVMKP